MALFSVFQCNLSQEYAHKQTNTFQKPKKKKTENGKYNKRPTTAPINQNYFNKNFLKRKSKHVTPQKVDWSHITPRVQSHLPPKLIPKKKQNEVIENDVDWSDV